MPGTPPGAHAPYAPSWSDAEDESEGGIKIGQIIDLIWSNKILLLAAALIGAAYATWSFCKRTPVYTARSSIVIEMQEQHVLNFQSVVPRASHSFFEMETELLELRSHDLMERVVERLDLGNDPEFNPALRYPISVWQERIGYYRILSGLGLVNPIAPQATEPQRLQDFSDNVDLMVSGFGMGEQPVPALPRADQAQKNALAILYSKVFVSRIADTYAFQITATSQLPETAEAIANAIADIYVGRKREIDYQAVDEAMQWLSDRISEQKEDLERTERSVESLIADTGLSGEDVMLANAQRLKGMRERQQDRIDNVSSMTKRLARLAALRSANDYAGLAAEIEAPRLRSYVLELNENPGDADLRERADLLLDALNAKITTQRDDAEVQASLLAAPITELDALVDSQGSDLVKLRQLRREAEAARIVYEYSLRRMREIAVQQGVRQREVRVASRASRPGAPSRGNAVTTITEGAAMGFGASIAFCCF